MRALIVGLGLIGGSAGMALRARGWSVTYFDPNVDEAAARDAGAADARMASLAAAIADVTLLAPPVDVAVDLLGRETFPGVVLSACSVMSPLRKAADARGIDLVCGHPMAGSHERSLSAAKADLFAGRRWFVDRRDTATGKLIDDVGAVAEVVEAEVHDRAVALTSHLPQILSTALGAYLAQQSEELLRFAGSGLETFLRLAASDAAVWRPILEANRENLAPHVRAVMKMAEEMAEGDPTTSFDAAQALHSRLRRE